MYNVMNKKYTQYDLQWTRTEMLLYLRNIVGIKTEENSVMEAFF